MISSPGLAQRPRVLILTPVFNEEAVLPLYEKAVRQALLSRTDYQFRVLFIEDGSTDRSWAVIQQICARDERFEGVRLSRNYGSHVALSAGFALADADGIATLACDLQDPPEVILRFLEPWRAGAHIVWGKRRTRADSVWRTWASGLFYRLLRRYAMPRGSKFTTGSFFLVDRQVAECVRQFREQSRIAFALVAWTGFGQAVVEYDRERRTVGKSGWSFSKMLRTMYDAFVGFSYLPVRLMTLLGGAAFLVAVLLVAYLLFCWFTGHPVPGWTSIMVGIAFFFGIQFLLMGVSGEYLHRIYLEVVRRPLYFISDRTPPTQSDGVPPNGGLPEELCLAPGRPRPAGVDPGHDR
jgi:dolichol-phosphate mannosyltransferase